MVKPLIFDIHRCALDDGPGVRTTVFLKGCPLSCIWCHNPESMSSAMEIAFYSEKCIGCGTCSQVCPNEAIRADLRDRINRQLCRSCGVCSNECPTLALKMIGQYFRPDELVSILMKDKVFYETSGGGVTFSGGEPTQYLDYLTEVMVALKNQGIHIALQTCGYFDFTRFRKEILPYLDLVFYDIKLIDSELHRKYTGKENHLILNNFKVLMNEASIPVIPRIPLIPGITDRQNNLTGIVEFLNQSGCNTYILLDYNPSGIFKRINIGKSVGISHK